MVIRSLIILLALTVSVSAQRICPPNQVNRNGLVGRWLVEGKQTGAVATPTRCLDDSNKGNHGTTVASPNYGVIFSRAAMTFNGSSQYVSLANQANFKLYPLTVSVWVKFGNQASNSSPGIVTKYSSGSINGWNLFIDNSTSNGSKNQPSFWYFAGSTSNCIWNGNSYGSMTVTGYNDNNWHLVTVTVNAGGGIMYVDGVSKATQGWTGTPGPDTDSIVPTIGYYNYGPSYFNGSIDDVRIYNRALSATEVRAIYRGEQ